MKSVPRAAPPPPIPPARYERSNSATLAPLQRTGGSRRRRLGCFFREALQRRGRPVKPVHDRNKRARQGRRAEWRDPDVRVPWFLVSWSKQNKGRYRRTTFFLDHLAEAQQADAPGQAHLLRLLSRNLPSG